MLQKNGNTVRPARGRALGVRRHDRQHGGRANRATAAVFCWERAARSMQLSVVRPSVCPICRPHDAAAGLLLWAERAGGIDR